MKKKFAIFAFAVVASLASCSSDGVESNPNFPADGVIRVAADVDDPISRAGQDLSNLILFNLSISYPGDETYSRYACMKTTGTPGDPDRLWDSFSAENGGITPLVLKWKDKMTSMFVTALGVNNKSKSLDYFTHLSTDSVEINQNTTEMVKASDIIYMPKTAINPTDQSFFDSNKRLKLKLKHRLSKLTIVLTLGTEFNTSVSKIDDIASFQVNGLKTKFQWNPSADIEKLTLDNNSLNPIIPYGQLTISPGSNSVATYECIVVPQDASIDAFNVSFAIKGTVYQLTLKALQQLLPGKAYQMALTVTKLEVTRGKLSISNWEDGI